MQVIDQIGKFKGTLSQPDFSPHEWDAVLAANWPSFEEVDIAKLVPDHMQDEYARAKL